MSALQSPSHVHFYWQNKDGVSVVALLADEEVLVVLDHTTHQSHAWLSTRQQNTSALGHIYDVVAQQEELFGQVCDLESDFIFNQLDELERGRWEAGFEAAVLTGQRRQREALLDPIRDTPLYVMDEIPSMSDEATA